MSDAVLFDVNDSVAVLTLNRPKTNPLSHDILEGLRLKMDQAIADAGVRVIIITASGDKVFCAGADLGGGFGDMSAVDFLKRGQDVFNKIEQSPKPVIAAMNGHALGGGCELAMACHFRFLKEGARMGLTETNLGIIPGYGGTLRLPRYVGWAKALELMMTGTQLGHEEAQAMGLVNHVVPEGEVLAKAEAFAETLSKRPPLAMKAILKIYQATGAMSPELHLRAEREALADLFSTEDVMEGMTAFMEKREAVFKGK